MDPVVGRFVSEDPALDGWNWFSYANNQPTLFADAHKMFNWAGNAQNLAITGAAWIVADFLAQNKSHSSTSDP
jgi:hypothetical protein